MVTRVNRPSNLLRSVATSHRHHLLCLHGIILNFYGENMSHDLVQNLTRLTELDLNEHRQRHFTVEIKDASGRLVMSQGLEIEADDMGEILEATYSVVRKKAVHELQLLNMRSKQIAKLLETPLKWANDE